LTKPQATKVLPIVGLDVGAIGSRSLFNLCSGGYEFYFLLLTSNFKSKPGSDYPAEGMLFPTIGNTQS
jgi:hypothetical protein